MHSKSVIHDSQGNEIWERCSCFSATSYYCVAGPAAAVLWCSFSTFHDSFPVILAISHSLPDLPVYWEGRKGKERKGRFLMLPARFPKGNSMGKSAGSWRSLLFPLLFCHWTICVPLYWKNVSEMMTQQGTGCLVDFYNCPSCNNN